MGYLVKQADRAPAVTAPVPVDESLPRACVIGAGSSGIAAAKQLYLAGIPFDCFERGHDVGGNWVFDNSNGSRPATRASRSTPRARGWPTPTSRCPSDYPPYARHDQVAAYFDAYVDHFGFRDTITFGTTVEEVTRAADGRWDVRITGPDGTETRTYDAVLVANGHHWDARWPEPAYPGRLRRRADARPRLPLPRPARRARRRRGGRRQLRDGHRGRVLLRGAHDDVVGAPHRVGAPQVLPRQAERPGSAPARLGAVVGDRAAPADRRDRRGEHDEVRTARAHAQARPVAPRAVGDGSASAWRRARSPRGPRSSGSTATASSSSTAPAPRRT